MYKALLLLFGALAAPSYAAQTYVATLLDCSTDTLQNYLFCTGSNAFYFKWTSTSGREPWRISGASGTAALVKEIVPGEAGSMDHSGNFTLGGKTNFFGRLVWQPQADGATPPATWISDGTAAGTHPLSTEGWPVHTLFIGAAPLPDGRGVFFESQKLWVSNGTFATSQVIKTLAEGAYFNADDILQLGSRVVFYVSGAAGGNLWSTDGTAAGTLALSNLSFPAIDTSSHPPTVFNGRMYIVGAPENGGLRYLYFSDGTAAGTGRVLIPFQSPLVSLNQGATSTIYPGNHFLWITVGSADADTTAELNALYRFDPATRQFGEVAGTAVDTLGHTGFWPRLAVLQPADTPNVFFQSAALYAMDEASTPSLHTLALGGPILMQTIGDNLLAGQPSAGGFALTLLNSSGVQIKALGTLAEPPTAIQTSAAGLIMSSAATVDIINTSTLQLFHVNHLAGEPMAFYQIAGTLLATTLDVSGPAPIASIYKLAIYSTAEPQWAEYR